MTDNSYLMAMRNPILQVQNQPINNTRRLTLEEEYNRLSDRFMPPNQNQQQFQSDPYTDCLSLLNSSSDIIREKILNDNQFQESDLYCESLLKQALYSKVLPEVLATQQGRAAFEERYLIAKTRKEEYIKQDLQKEKEFEQLKALMQDEEIQKVLQQKISKSQQPQQTNQNVDLNQHNKHNKQHNLPQSGGKNNLINH